MNDFVWYNPTEIIFGKGKHREVGMYVKKYANRILLHYGGGSVKKTGTLDVVKQSLQDAGVEYVELGGVKPNPRVSLVREGIEICRREKLNFILAVGGGSVIDSAKGIAVGVPYEGDVWELYATEKQPVEILPVGVVLTIPAAGTESGDGSVLNNEETQDKRSCCSPVFYPKFAILNPELCYTLPRRQIAAGGIDMLAHVMERYFVPNEPTLLTDQLCEGTMRTIIDCIPRVMEDPTNYDLWAEVMWCGTVAHNGFIGKGRLDDWASHEMEHQLSALYDMIHGEGLAIMFPAWMEYVRDAHPWRFVDFAVKVFQIDPENKSQEEIISQGIQALKDFYHRLGVATTMTEAGIENPDIERMTEQASQGAPLGNFVKLHKNDIRNIYNLAK